MNNTSSRQPITVSVVARLPLQQYGLGALIDQDPDLVAGQTVAAIDRVTVGSQPRPHVILYYLDEGCSGSSELIRALIEQGMQIIVVMSRGPSIHPASMVQLGVRGVVGTNIGRREFSSAVRHVAWGRSYISPSIASDLLHPDATPAGDLTARELEVLVRVAAGDTDREIARMLRIAVRTVRSHLDNVRAKTGARRRPDLTRFAIMNGIWPDTEAPTDLRSSASRATG